MLRSMTPEQVKQVIEFHRDLNFFQAVELAKREGRLIVPNDIHDRILTETKDVKYLRQNYPVWTGTLVIYEKPDRPFGEQAVFSWQHNEVNYSISFEVPEQFRGKRNCALVIEHPDFELIDFGDNRYELKAIDESNIHLVQNFAKQNGWHLTDHGIPVGVEVASSKDPEERSSLGDRDRRSRDARYFWRRLDGSYIGLWCRDLVGYDRGRGVGAGARSSDVLGVHTVPLTAKPSNFDL